MAAYSTASIAQFFQSKGLNANAVSGILGNWQIESQFDPTAYNSNEQAIGFAQWERERRTRLQDYARQTGSTETNPVTQLNFAWSEIESRNLVTSLNNAGSPENAAAIFDAQFEGSDGKSRTQRETAAKAWSKTHVGPNGDLRTNLVGTPPYTPATLKEPITDAERNKMIDYLAKQHGPASSAGYKAAVKQYQAMQDHGLYITYMAVVTNALPKADPGYATPGVGPLPGIGDWMSSLGKALGWLTSVSNWERIGMFVLGGILLLLAAVKLLGNSGSIAKAAVMA